MTNDARAITLDITDDGSTILIQSSPMDKELIKLVPGTRWNADLDRWTIKAKWASCMALKGIIGDRLRVSEKIKDYAAGLLSEYIAPQRALREVMTFTPEMQAEFEAIKNETFSPLPYQPGGALFLANPNLEQGMSAGSCLFDPMGTGKTAQVVMAVRILANRGVNLYPLLIVAPNSVKSVWLENFATWAPMVRVEDAGNSAKTRKACVERVAKGEVDVMIVNWESLPKNSSLAPYGGTSLSPGEKAPQLFNSIRWKGVVADELHRGKNPLAKQTRALWKLAHGPDVIWRKGLTGTPIANTPADLWSALHFCDPEEFASKSKWLDRYCLIGFGQWGGMDVLGIKPETREEFDHTTEHYWRRVPKEIALPNLPPKVPVRRVVTLSASQKKQYDAMRDQMIVELAESEIIAVNPLAKLTRLLQFASATCTVVDGKVTMTDPSCKIDELLDILDEVEGQVVVFSVSRKLIELAATRLEKAGHTYGMITGSISVDERKKNVNIFQSDEGLKRMRVMLCTIAAGGTGITLTNASTVVFLQRDFSAIQNSQAEDRCHRIGSEIHESILIIDVVSENTVDFRVQELAAMKVAQLQDLVRDADRLRKVLSGDETVALIADTEGEDVEVATDDDAA